jgi:Ca2+/Na+ antiporter
LENRGVDSPRYFASSVLCFSFPLAVSSSLARQVLPGLIASTRSLAATVIAVGISAPELATAVVAKLRRHDEIALGTILGQQYF